MLHIGLLVDGDALVIQARETVDYLDCEIIEYCGARETTAQALTHNAQLFGDDFLAVFNQRYPTKHCTKLAVDARPIDANYRYKECRPERR